MRRLISGGNINAQPWTQNGLNNGFNGNVFGTSTNHSIQIFSSGLANERMCITETGFVGIGTTFPQNLLHVNGALYP
jgi:hypothetical protein